MSEKKDPEKVICEIKRKARREYDAEEKIRIVLEKLWGEEGKSDINGRGNIILTPALIRGPVT